ncbi:synaptotagmin-16 [Ditylenchus destructor]|uniref:Synaptotagmin-16 n=1 Tax=Ditylenchus destructor TaxID=166010 RepID=A0AAD4N8E1_9BILA|nr:synaptotagmin-16 [Ditylenchus destructor]
MLRLLCSCYSHCFPYSLIPFLKSTKRNDHQKRSVPSLESPGDIAKGGFKNEESGELHPASIVLVQQQSPPTPQLDSHNNNNLAKASSDAAINKSGKKGSKFASSRNSRYSNRRISENGPASIQDYEPNLSDSGQICPNKVVDSLKFPGFLAKFNKDPKSKKMATRHASLSSVSSDKSQQQDAVLRELASSFSRNLRTCTPPAPPSNGFTNAQTPSVPSPPVIIRIDSVDDTPSSLDSGHIESRCAVAGLKQKETNATAQNVHTRKKSTPGESTNGMTDIKRHSIDANIYNHRRTSRVDTLTYNCDASPFDPHNATSLGIGEKRDSTVSVPTPTYGTIRIAFQYSNQKKLLILTVLESELDLTPTAVRTSADGSKEVNVQVRLALLSDKVVKFRTKFRPVNDAIFNETFVFSLLPEELAESVVRLRVYQWRLRSNVLLGEAFLKACLVDPQNGASSNHLLNLRAPIENAMSLFPQLLNRGSAAPNAASAVPANGTPASTASPARAVPSSFSTLPTGLNSLGCGSGCGTPISTPTTATAMSASRRSSTVDDCGRFATLPQSDGTPEMLVSLCYVVDQSQLVVVVEKATGFDCSSSTLANYLANIGSTLGSPLANGVNKAPDTFVRVAAVSQAGVELGKHKSETVKASINPVYNHTAVFHIARNDLEISNVLIQIFSYCGILRRKVMLGWICVGGENASSPDAQQHWQDMIQGMGTTVDKWHHLLPPSPRT